jgi:hypothetical protein
MKMNDTKHRLLSQKNRISGAICWFLFQVAWLAAASLTCEAYFCPVFERSTPPAFLLRPKTGVPTMESSVLVMPNNKEFNNRSGTGVGDRSMDPGRHVFVSYLPVVEIVTQQSHRYMPSEFSIDNLLYANLKLDRLVNEYEGLRERSQSILNGLNVPFVNGSQNFNNLIEKKNDGLNRSINRVANQKTSIAGPLANSNRWKEQKGFSTAANGGRTATNQRLTFERRAISYSSGGASRVEETSQTQSDSNPEQAREPAEAIQKLQYGAQQEKQLPWLARAVRSLGKYLRENKVEAMVVLLFLLIVHQLIFSSRK